jgi:hypothetical protein
MILTQIFFNLYWDAHCPATYSVPYRSFLQHTPTVLRCPHHKAGHVLEIISYAGLDVITLNGLSCGSRTITGTTTPALSPVTHTQLIVTQ